MEFLPDEGEAPMEPEPTGDSLVAYGYDLEPLPEGRVPTGLMVIIRHVESDGTGAPGLSFRGSPDLASWEAVGMLRECLRDAEMFNAMTQEYFDVDGDDDF